MVYWGKDFDGFAEVFLDFGAVVDLRPLQGKRIGDRERRVQPRLFAEV
jgi:hypothetical protein